MSHAIINWHLFSPAAPKARDGKYCNAPRPSVDFFTETFLSHFISRYMLYGDIDKCPFIYWLNGRWFLHIVDRDSGNLYPIYPLFPCSDCFISNWGGGGG